MTKEEMKNRISMAIKDPILQQGFEIICKNLVKLESRNDELVKMYNEMVERQNSLQQSLYKNLAELEKENAELKTEKIPQLERKIASIRGCHSVDAKKLNSRIKQVERLKKQVSAMSKALVNVVSESDEVKGQLTKAKEFIRKLSRLKHHTDDPFTYDEYLKLIKEVEQFLRDCDIDNAIQQANEEYKNAKPQNQVKILRQKISDAEKEYQKYLINHPELKEEENAEN